MRRALITGITGQDGSYLAEFLLERGYEVYGLVRRSSTCNRERIRHLEEQPNRLVLLNADMLDQHSLISALRESKPDEIYNLAAMSFVQTSFGQASMTAKHTAVGVAHLLEAIILACPEARFFQASSSEMFGNATVSPQNEHVPFHPCNPYGVAKLYGHWLTSTFREAHNLFACSGIMFNHESPRRGIEFVSRHISRGVARIKVGLQRDLPIGNLDARRDWGFAGEYVEAMWLMLNKCQRPDDYIIATGTSHSVRDFIEAAFAYVGIYDWERYVIVDSKRLRAVDIRLLVGDASKAHAELGWAPKCAFETLVGMMVQSDLDRVT